MPNPASGAFTLRDLVVTLFIVALLPISASYVAHRSREPAIRIKCASNLRQIGQAMQIYANANGGEFPRTDFDGTANPVPTEFTGASARPPYAPGGPAPNDVTARLVLLMRTTDIISDAFICPTSAEQWDVSPWPGDPMQASNFPGRVHLTYAYANPYPSQAAVAAGFRFDNTLGS